MAKKRITIIPGDGIGPNITDATIAVLDKLDCGLEYDFTEAGITSLDNQGELLPQKTLDLIQKNKITLKGPLMTPIGEGFKSINVTLRQKFELYANLRPVISFPNTSSRYDNINLITIRENTEGMYSGEGQVITETENGERAEALSVITSKGAERILKFAFETTNKRQLKKVTVVHKANILKSTSGLFLKVAREVAKNFPKIEMNEMIVDNTCMQLVMNPHQFEVIVTTNLFGDIISDLSAGLVGGLGMAPGANIGDNIAIFEAVHGSAPDIAGKNIANPTALILASALMLDHLGMTDKAERTRNAIRDVLKNKDRLTRDLGGTAGTKEYTEALIDRL